MIEIVYPYASGDEKKTLDEFTRRREKQTEKSAIIRPANAPGIVDIPHNRITGLDLSNARDAEAAEKINFWRDERELLFDEANTLHPLAIAILARVTGAKDNPQSRLDAERTRLAGELRKLGFVPNDEFVSGHPAVAKMKAEADKLASNYRARCDPVLFETDLSSRRTPQQTWSAGFSGKPVYNRHSRARNFNRRNAAKGDL